jgi:hypothetical protein
MAWLKEFFSKQTDHWLRLHWLWLGWLRLRSVSGVEVEGAASEGKIFSGDFLSTGGSVNARGNFAGACPLTD